MSRFENRHWAPVFLLLSLATLAIPARSETNVQCPAVVSDWARAASTDLELPLEPRACHGPLVRLRLRPHDAPPIDVEVAAPPGPAFLRAGRLRVNPIVDVPDYSLLPAGQRRGVESLVTWLTEHEESILFTATPTMALGPSPAYPLGFRHVGPWLLILALALLLVGRGLLPLRRQEVLLLLSCVSVGLGLRWVFGIWGPHHINGQGPLWIRAAIDSPGLLSAYGPGYPEVYSAVAALSEGAPDTMLFACNALLSAFAAALIYLLARELDLDNRRAALAAWLWALDPISIRFSASEGYFTIIVLFTLLTALCTCRGIARLAAGKRLQGLALLLAASLFAASVVRVHPVSWIPIALAPLLALASNTGEVPPRKRIAFVVGFLLVIVSVVWLCDAHWISARFSNASGLLAPEDEAFDWRALPFASALVGFAVWFSPRRWLVAVACLSVAAVLLTSEIYGQSELWRASYQRLFFPSLLLGSAAFLPRRLAEWRSIAAVVAVFCFVGVAHHWPGIVRRTTEQMEYETLRSTIAREVPTGCRLAHLPRVGLRVVEIPDYLSGGRTALRLSDLEELTMALQTGACLVLIRTSICSSSEGRALCESIEGGAGEREVLERTSLPANPSHDQLPYDTEEVEIVVWLLNQQRGSGQ